LGLGVRVEGDRGEKRGGWRDSNNWGENLHKFSKRRVSWGKKRTEVRKNHLNKHTEDRGEKHGVDKVRKRKGNAAEGDGRGFPQKSKQEREVENYSKKALTTVTRVNLPKES